MSLLWLIFIESAVVVYFGRRDFANVFLLVCLNMLAVALYGAKLVSLGGFETNATNVCYAGVVTGLLVIQERFGKNEVLLTLFLTIVTMTTFLMLQINIAALPVVPGNEQFSAALSTVAVHPLGIAIASYLAFLATVMTVLGVGAALARQPVWLRVAVSLITAQAVDSQIFFRIAFSILPSEILNHIVLNGFIVKVILTALFVLLALCGKRNKNLYFKH